MIEHYSFGKIVIDGITYTSDLKIISSTVIANWWRNKGHLVEITDVRDIIKANTEILILGKGKPGLMKSTRSLRDFLNKNNIGLIEESTSDAIRSFNRLSIKNKNISAGFHLTC